MKEVASFWDMRIASLVTTTCLVIYLYPTNPAYDYDYSAVDHHLITLPDI
jgi:hypothetical protein